MADYNKYSKNISVYMLKYLELLKGFCKFCEVAII